MAVSHVFNSPTADWTGTVTIFNSAGATTTAAATDLVRPSDWDSAHNQFVTLTGNTSNASTLSGTNIFFEGLAGVTLRGSSNSVGFSAAGAPTVSYFQDLNPSAALSLNSGTTAQTGASTQSTWSVLVHPLSVPVNVAFNQIFIRPNWSTAAGTGSATVMFGIVLYTLTGDTLSKMSQFYFNQIASQNSVTGLTINWWWGTNSTSNSSQTSGNVSTLFTTQRQATIFTTGGATLTPGMYYVGVGHVGRSAGVNFVSGSTRLDVPSGAGVVGDYGSNTSKPPWFAQFQGMFTTTTNTNFTRMTMPDSINTTAFSTTAGFGNPLNFIRTGTS